MLKPFSLLLMAFAASFATYADNVIFEDDFEWLEPWSSQDPVGQTVETDNSEVTVRQLATNKVDGVSTYEALIAKGYEILATCHSSKTPRQPDKQTYLQRNYLKFGLTGYYSGITLPEMTGVPEGALTTISFDWCSHRQGSGVWDDTQLVVVVKNGEDEQQFLVPAHQYVKGEQYSWLPVFVELGTSVKTGSKVMIRPIDEQWPSDTGGTLRWYIDNIKVAEAAAPTVDVRMPEAIEIPVLNSVLVEVKVVEMGAHEVSRQWTSGNPDVARVTDAGYVVGVSEGNCAVTLAVTTDTGEVVTASANVTVRALRAGDSFVDSDFGYRILPAEAAEVEVTAYNGSERNCTVPSQTTVSGTTYTVVGTKNTFQFNDYVKEVTLPVTLRTIGDSTFCRCSSLETVNIPLGVTSIKGNAFRRCTSLKKIELPSTLTELGDFVFFACDALEGIVIPEGVTTIGRQALSYCAALVDVKLPSTLLFLGRSVFLSSTSLVSVDVPASVRELPQSIFDGCTSLRNVTLHEGLKIISEHAFRDVAMTTLSIPASVHEIGAGIINGSRSLEEIEVAEGNTYCKSVDNILYTIDSSTLLAYPEGKPGTAFVVPSGVKTIESEAFGNARLIEVTLPESLERFACDCLQPWYVEKVYSLAKTAPSIFPDILSEYYSRAVLYIPVGSLESYVAAGWKEMGFLDIVEESLSGIEDVMTENHEPDVYYDLYGRRVDNPAPGNIYIVNGRKVVRR